jgi:hypothetical protein
VIGLADAAAGRSWRLRCRRAESRWTSTLREKLAKRLSYKVPRRFLLLPDDAVPVPRAEL